MGCTIGSRGEVLGEGKPVIRGDDDDDNNYNNYNNNNNRDKGKVVPVL
jgi:hypothetical protein